MKTIKDYQKQLDGKKCRFCKEKLEHCEIKMYNHPAGYEVEGMTSPQWLYVVCPKCGYEWSLKKLNIQ
jgi:predicted  nucleic acid-binding Zn ribbon protein